MRCLYKGDALTRPDLVNLECDPVKDKRGKCIVSTKMATALVIDGQGRKFVVKRRRLRLIKDGKHDT